MAARGLVWAPPEVPMETMDAGSSQRPVPFRMPSSPPLSPNSNLSPPPSPQRPAPRHYLQASSSSHQNASHLTMNYTEANMSVDGFGVSAFSSFLASSNPSYGAVVREAVNPTQPQPLPPPPTSSSSFPTMPFNPYSYPANGTTLQYDASNSGGGVPYAALTGMIGKFPTRFAAYGPEDYNKRVRKDSDAPGRPPDKRRRRDSPALKPTIATATFSVNSTTTTTITHPVPLQSKSIPMSMPPLPSFSSIAGPSTSTSASASTPSPYTMASPSFFPSPEITEPNRRGDVRPSSTGRKITPVTKDVPLELVDQPLDDLYEEIMDLSPALLAPPHIFPDAGPSSSMMMMPPPPPPVMKYKCKICEHAFPKKHTVLTHIKTHLGKKPFICTQDGCDMAFVREHDRKRHQLTHTGVRPYVCACGKEFSRQDALRRHSTYGRCPVRDPSLLNTIDDNPEEGELPSVKIHDGESSPVPSEPPKKPKIRGKHVATGRPRGRPKKVSPATDGSNARASPSKRPKKKKSSAYGRPVGEGDSELDEDDDERGRSVASSSKGKKREISQSPEAEAEELDVVYEDEDPSSAPTSFLFAIPGLHSKAMIDRVRTKSRSTAPDDLAYQHAALPPSSQRRSARRSPSPGLPFVPRPINDEAIRVPFVCCDPYPSIMDRMRRSPFPSETTVQVSEAVDSALPSFKLRPVGAAQEIPAGEDPDDDWSDEDNGDVERLVQKAGSVAPVAEGAYSPVVTRTGPSIGYTGPFWMEQQRLEKPSAVCI